MHTRIVVILSEFLFKSFFWFMITMVFVNCHTFGQRYYFEKPLEELLETEITSVSKKSEKISEAAASVYIITREDIRRAGVTSIPEALRLAPGVVVVRIDSNKWAISIHGFVERIANKLLVLMDGRTLYTPLFGGVFWEHHDTVLEDIERIEVIRGPMPTVWGANAVNGVIHIVTKNASETEGGMIEVGGGNEEKLFTTLRYGGKILPDLYYRVYGKFFERGSFSEVVPEEVEDDWRLGTGGFRMDWDLSIRDSLMLQTNFFDGTVASVTNDIDTDPNAQPPFSKIVNTDVDIKGVNVTGLWEHGFENESGIKLQLLYDRVERRDLQETQNTYDMEFQHDFSWGTRNTVTWGFGHRVVNDVVRGQGTSVLKNPSQTKNLTNIFLQDKIEVKEDRLYLTLGSKLEHNDFTGLEIQPNVRLLYKISKRQSIWSAVSRAVRTPTILEEDLLALFGRVPFLETINGVTVQGVADIIIEGADDLDSEELFAYEIGYRTQAIPRLTLDCLIFYNDYTDLAVPETQLTGMITGPPNAQGIFPASAVATRTVNRKGSAESYGAELSLYWQATDRWRLSSNYSWFRLQFHSPTQVLGESTDTLHEAETPRNQFHVRSSLDLPFQLNFDTSVYYTDSTRSNNVAIDSRIRVDVRLAWRPSKNLELSLVAQDIFDDQHLESGPSPTSELAAEVERSFYGSIKWQF